MQAHERLIFKLHGGDEVDFDRQSPESKVRYLCLADRGAAQVVVQRAP